MLPSTTVEVVLFVHYKPIDNTLDYSGHALNRGSKVVIAAAGAKRRNLLGEIPGDLRLPHGLDDPRVVLPGVLAVSAPKYQVRPDDTGLESGEDPSLDRFCRSFNPSDSISRFAFVVLVDDAEFTARSVRNFLWVTFTRSNPAADIDGIGAFCRRKHWGCAGPIVVDARIKPRHAPPLVDDPSIERKVEALAAPGRPLHGVI